MPRAWIRAADWKRSSTEFPEPPTLNCNSKPYFSCVYKMRIPRTQASVYICYAEKQRKSGFSKMLLTMWGKEAGCFRIETGFKWKIKQSPAFLREAAFVYIVEHVLLSMMFAWLVLLIVAKKQLVFFKTPWSNPSYSPSPLDCFWWRFPPHIWVHGSQRTRDPTQRCRCYKINICLSVEILLCPKDRGCDRKLPVATLMLKVNKVSCVSNMTPLHGIS